MPIDLVVAGAAAKTTITAPMTVASPGGGGTFAVVSAAGYPVTGKFAVVISRGLADEEKILINSRSGTTYTVGQRGYDGTAAADHSSGATCELALPAVTVQALIDHENGTDPNPHSGILLNNAAHDITARHVFGGAFAVPAAPPAIAMDGASAAGVAGGPARSDHAHGFTAGAASTITGTNSEGASSSGARADHNHAVGGTNHIPAAALVNKSVAAAQLTDGIITNGSTLLGSNQQLIYVQATNPGAVGAGKIWYNTTAGKRAMLQRNAADTAWMVIQSMDDIDYTPTYPGMAAVGNATHFARYSRHGAKVIVNGFFRLGNTTSFVGLTNLAISLPTNAQAKDLDSVINYPTNGNAEFYGHGAARGFINATGGTWGAVGIVTQGGPAKALDRVHFFATGGSGSWAQSTPGGWLGNDRFSWFVEYEPATLEDANWV